MTTAPAVEPQLCHGEYQALKLSNCVVISATGVHMSSGYTVFFKKSPLDIFPPQFSLMHIFAGGMLDVIVPFSIDRKSTRLNSSHVAISYAVFCLKKKKNARIKGFLAVPVDEVVLSGCRL